MATRPTLRAYALRLSARGSATLSPLWRTHQAVNAGACAFGNWLLTLRGGLDYRLIDAQIQQKRGQRSLTAAERRSRRVLLALSWLSVETRAGAPAEHIVRSTADPSGARWHTVEGLIEILVKRGLGEAEIAVWVADCTPSLTAAIKPEAVWVDRSAAFDDAVAQLGPSLTRDEVWDLLGLLFGKPEVYLAIDGSVPEADDVEEENGEERNGAARTPPAKDLAQSAGQWLSSRFGSGSGTDFTGLSAAYHAIATWAESADTELSPAEFARGVCAALAAFDPAPKDLDGVEHLLRQRGQRSTTRRLLARLAVSQSITERDLDHLRISVILLI